MRLRFADLSISTIGRSVGAQIPIARIVLFDGTKVSFFTACITANIIDSQLAVFNVAAFPNRIAAAAFAAVVSEVVDMLESLCYCAGSAVLIKGAALVAACDPLCA